MEPLGGDEVARVEPQGWDERPCDMEPGEPLCPFRLVKPALDRGASPRQTPNLPAPRSWASSLQNHEKESPTVSKPRGLWCYIWQPEWTKTDSQHGWRETLEYRNAAGHGSVSVPSSTHYLQKTLRSVLHISSWICAKTVKHTFLELAHSGDRRAVPSDLGQTPCRARPSRTPPGRLPF